MMLLISCDMEGISGVVDWEQTRPGTSEWERGRRWMTGDVNAAVRAAFEAGADQVVVSDAHGRARNLLLEELDARVALHSGHPAPVSMLQGIDAPERYDGLIFVGYHARAGTLDSVLCHTWSDNVAAVWLNDVLVGEIGLNAALAGHFGTPLIAIAGDLKACQEAQELIGSQLEVAPVKTSIGRFAARCLPFEESRRLIHQAVSRAVNRLKAGQAPKPFVIARPVRLAVEYLRPNLTDRAAWLPGSRRVSATRLEYDAKDMWEVMQAFRSMTALAVE